MLRSIRDEYQDYEPILDDDAVDLLLGVIAAHPQVAEKVGVGIAGFFVARSPDFPTRCFYLKRVDSSQTDFSWNEAISPTTPIVRLRMACRNAVMSEKLAFRDNEWPANDMSTRPCPITGESFSRVQAHVDHQPPQTLMKLVDDWLMEDRLSIDDIPINHTGDLRSVDTFADADQEILWKEFHAENAQLRIVSAAGNLRQGARLLDL